MKNELLLACLLSPVICFSQVSGWMEQNSEVNASLHNVFALDEVHAWALGSTHVLIMTTDGGLNWENTTMPFPATCIHFFNPLHGIAAGGSNIMTTSDGGYSWSTEPCGLNTNITHMSFADSLNGWMIGNPGEVILHTSNGGMTWQNQSLGMNDLSLKRIDFADPDHGWILAIEEVGFPEKNYHLFNTINGGQSWTLEKTWGSGSYSGTHIYDLCAIDSMDLWVGGNVYDYYSFYDLGIAEQSTNGGHTFPYGFYFEYAPAIESIHFPDAMHGWALFYNQVYTLDFTTGWPVQQYITDGIHLNSVYFTDSLNGWVVGDSGIVLHTCSGGMVDIKERTNIHQESFDIFPNPCSSSLHILLPELSDKGIINIYKAGGSCMLRTSVFKKSKQDSP